MAAEQFAATVLPIIASLQKSGVTSYPRHCNRPEQPWRSNSARRRVAGVECAQYLGESDGARPREPFISGN